MAPRDRRPLEDTLRRIAEMSVDIVYNVVVLSVQASISMSDSSDPRTM